MDTTYFDQVRTEISDLLPPTIGTVMEVGCAKGLTLQWLKDNYGAKYTIGVELSEEAAQEASQICNEVYIADITSQLSLLKPFEKRIDLLLLLEILEHLSDPWEAVRQMKTVLADDGIIIASIPNVRSIKVVGPLLLRGKWEYSNSGILDQTHLRFFTKESALNLFRQNGFDVLAIRANGALDFSKAKTPSGKLAALFNLLSLCLFEGLIANQWLIAARPRASA